MHSISQHHSQPPQLQQYLYQQGVASQLPGAPAPSPFGNAPPGAGGGGNGNPGVGANGGAGGLGAGALAAAAVVGGGVAGGAGADAQGAGGPVGVTGGHLDEEKVYQLILDLTNPNTREQALLELSKKREAYEDLAPILWHSFGGYLGCWWQIVAWDRAESGFENGSDVEEEIWWREGDNSRGPF
ncbi:Cell differentiation protein RCD1 [Rhizophlyctis rosea]|uniref:Cell differentiation protein RCD1 n=1 Tax=Rhizophlyctis rosea TaxID=64517 RepID=A0AAD5SER7_9FUNG|nr:Cell differentiation protein RCD1 [Rhizophlyctis rosea]